jgi:RHS repeat-associated protein
VTTTYPLPGVEEDLPSGERRHQYLFAGQVVAQRTLTSSGATTGLVYLHGDHLGSVSAATSSTGSVLSKQDYTPWGEVRSGDVPQTTLDFTGQRRDGTGLLHYQARQYDPKLGLFISADTIVPGTASWGAMLWNTVQLASSTPWVSIKLLLTCLPGLGEQRTVDCDKGRR